MVPYDNLSNALVGAEITKIQDVKAHINTTVILNIEIIGLPSPSVNWYFGQPSRHISSTDNHYKYLDNGTLKITQLNFIDVGQYDVEVQNEIDGQVYRQRKQLTLSGEVKEALSNYLPGRIFGAFVHLVAPYNMYLPVLLSLYCII